MSGLATQLRPLTLVLISSRMEQFKRPTLDELILAAITAHSGITPARVVEVLPAAPTTMLTVLLDKLCREGAVARSANRYRALAHRPIKSPPAQSSIRPPSLAQLMAGR